MTATDRGAGPIGRAGARALPLSRLAGPGGAPRAEEPGHFLTCTETQQQCDRENGVPWYSSWVVILRPLFFVQYTEIYKKKPFKKPLKPKKNLKTFS